MAIKLTDKIHTVAAGVDTVNKGSAQANAGREAYTLQEVQALIGGGNITVSDQGEGRMVFCTDTEDELKCFFSVKYDSSTNTMNFISIVWALANHYASSDDTSPAYFGRGVDTYRSITTVTLTPATFYVIEGVTVTPSNATSESNVSTGFLAWTAGPGTVGFIGMIIKGNIVQASTLTGSNGSPVYLDTTDGGATSTRPTASGNVVRVIGYKINNKEIYFDPSQDWTVIP